MRKIITGFATAAIVAVSALAFTPQTASAQGFSITFGTGQPPMVRYHDHGPRYDHRPVRRSWRHGPRHHSARDCAIRTERFWNGFRWVTEQRRVCG
jgi:Spy/CpxP family protein refolding chaperone